MLPRLLVIDDRYGRPASARGANQARVDLCQVLGLVDVTGDHTQIPVTAPVAEALFISGQRFDSTAGADIVVNDLDCCVATAAAGYRSETGIRLPWAAILLDLVFCTGAVEGGGMATPTAADLESPFGLRVLEAIQRSRCGIPVFMLSAERPARHAERYANDGASAYLWKEDDAAPPSRPRLQSALRTHGLLPDPATIIMGSSGSLLSALRDARRAGPNEAVLICGESGTGKELLANYLHTQFPSRRLAQFTAVNCGALTDSLLESELFGHVRGAFTDAKADRRGLFEQAGHGTVFLDEIGETSLKMQAQLLRVLQEGEIRKVGGDRTTAVHARVVAATNKHLLTEVAAGRFREDLYFRLNKFVVTLPPLRERADDIPELAHFFLHKAIAQLRTFDDADVRVSAFTTEALDRLRSMPWPGNVRQLKNIVDQSVSAARHLPLIGIRAIEMALTSDLASERPLAREPSGHEMVTSLELATWLSERLRTSAAVSGQTVRYSQSVVEIESAITELCQMKRLPGQVADPFFDAAWVGLDEHLRRQGYEWTTGRYGALHNKDKTVRRLTRLAQSILERHATG